MNSTHERIIIGEEDRLLPVQLTEAERNEYSLQLAEKIRDLKDAQDEKKRIVKEIGDAIKTQEADTLLISERVRTGKEYRETRCLILQDVDSRSILTQRNDTGEIVERRPMTKAEIAQIHQMRMEVD